MSKVQILRSVVNQRLNAAVEEVFELFERTIAEYEEQLRASKEENHRQQKLLDAVLNPEIQLERTDVGQRVVRREEVLPKQQLMVRREEVHPDLQLLVRKEEVLPDQQLMVRREEVLPEQQLMVRREEVLPKHQLMMRREEVLPEQQERSSSLNQVIEPPHIKEEQDDLWRGQEREQLQGAEEDDINVFEFNPVIVKIEDEDGEEPQSSQLEGNPENRDTERLKTGADRDDYRGPEPDGDFNPDVYLEPVTPEETSDLSGSDTDDSGGWEESDEPQEGLNPLPNANIGSDEKNNTGNTSVSSSECSTSFGQKKQLKRHHVEKPFSCSICGKKYPKERNLKGHMLRHSTEKPFSCSVCNRSFIKKTEMVTHMRSHTGEKPFQCDVCGKRFTQSGSLKSHTIVHTGVKPFSCSVCGKDFFQRGQLKQHLAVHTGEKHFSCPFCKKSFYSRAKTERHMRVHTGERPYSCSVCGKSFSHSGTLKQHAVVHTEEKPFGCTVCNKTFSRLFTFKNHKCVDKSSQT
ncbi:zinc finger protein 2-like [Cheilinus undulatus]|uniref:zinc finger protein 2-like n=1 Tax=Cheilinus undulatus TaxID=241271 RepID=UPI001BD68D76|nr:zinc finger protein 2-like [Cheilinus undulatus]